MPSSNTWWGACFAILAGCHDPYDVCAIPDASASPSLPQRLSETGLYLDLGTRALASGVRSYTPTFPLWSDGAAKRRWILLPPNTTIDTHDMDDWRFPVGTRLWKEFDVDGRPVETRLLVKVGSADDAWAAMAYVWRADGSDAIATPAGIEHANGTPHEVPAAHRCVGCHGGRRSFVLGFSAIQLAHSAVGSDVDLESLARAGLLDDPPRAPIDVPGDALERAALGYLHANCAHCHNQARPTHDGPRCYDPRRTFDFRLVVDRLDRVEHSLAYDTARGEAFVPGHAEGSRMVQLMQRRGSQLHMPPLATDFVDTEGVDIVSRWIDAM